MRALILIDIQNDFLPGGALAVPRGDEVIPVANRLTKLKGRGFDHVLMTQDYHPADHGSFASNNGAKVGSVGELAGLPQVMWPDHCVQGTRGVEFASGLDAASVDRIVRKGMDREIDSYSGFFDNGQRKATGLDDELKSRGVREVVIMGLATDYCVKFSALDALRLGYRVSVVSDGCRAVDLKSGDGERALAEMRAAGARIVTSEALCEEIGR